MNRVAIVNRGASCKVFVLQEREKRRFAGTATKKASLSLIAFCLKRD
jgi:hypothetical protein